MKKTAALFCLIPLVSISALAVVNPEPDLMGLYWDTEADICCIPVLPGQTNLYIILTNPTMDAISGFECAFTMETFPLPFLLSETFANPHAANFVDAGFQGFIVGFATPTICTQATLLVTVNVGNFAGVPVDFYLHEADPASIPGTLPVLLLTDDSLVQVNTPNPGGVTARQAIDCSVATDNASWGRVKSLYR